MRCRGIPVFGLGLFSAVGLSQQLPTVQWTASVQHGALSQESYVKLDAAIPQGWHIYGSSQLPGGPMPLLIRAEPNTLYEAAGIPKGTPPQHHHDASFNLDTEYYVGSIQLNVPFRALGADTQHQIALSVRYQMCSDTTCLPPRTTHLIAKLNP